MTSISVIFAPCKRQDATKKTERHVIGNKGLKIRWLAQLLLGLCLLGISLPVYSQSAGADIGFEWITQAGGRRAGGQSGGYAGINAITTDAAGNSYIYGRLHEEAIFGATTLTNNVKYTESFIAKLDPAGNFIWAKQQPLGDGTTIPGSVTGETAYVTGIAADSSGNCYITGRFRSVITLGATKFKSSNGGANTDMFIAKMDNNGNFLWTKQIVGGSTNSGQGFPTDIAADAAGNCYVTGAIHETVTFGSTTLTGTWAGMPFITKLDPAGNFIWVNKIEGGHIPGIEIKGVAVDNSGNCYIAGSDPMGASFGPFTSHYNTSADIFIAKLDVAGNFQWMKEAGYNTHRASDNEYDEVYEIAVDASGNSYITGLMRKTAIFGPTTLKADNHGRVFIAKLDATGDFLWARQIEGSAITNIHVLGIAADASGNSYVTGPYSSQKPSDPIPRDYIAGEPVFFGPDTLTTTKYVSMYIAKLDAGGNFLWAKGVDSALSPGLMIGEGRIAANVSGSCYLVGGFWGPVGAIALDANTLTPDNGDIFICKISEREEGQGVGMAGRHAAGNITPIPNPFSQQIHLQIDLQKAAGADISVYDLTGRQVYSLENRQLPEGKSTIVLSRAFESVPTGLYMVRVSLDNGAKWVRKVVKVVK